MLDNVEFPIAKASDRPLYDLICSNVIAPVITLAQELQLFSALDGRSQTIEEVACKLNILPTVSEAIIAVLAAFGLLERQNDARFKLTNIAKTYMLPDSLFFYTELCPNQEANLNLLRMKVKSGSVDPPAPLTVQMNQHPVPFVEQYTRRMRMGTLPAAARVAHHPIFKTRSHLLDIGGGAGSIAMAIAAFNPNIQCTIMDLTPVGQIAHDSIQHFGLQHQVHTLTQDIFAGEWPKGYDSIFFGNIFHNWDSETCYFFARRAFDCLEPGGQILLHEMPLNEGKDGPLTVACLSAIMLMYERGKQYTLKELEQMLLRVGFSDFESAETHNYHHLITATKPHYRK